MLIKTQGWKPVFKKEFKGYFTTPLAYIFLVIFLVLQGVFTFYLGRFFDRGQADLVSFFSFQPWLFLFFGPAIAMRLWAEERRTGTIELLMTLPISLSGAIGGKYLAAFTFTALAIALTFPIWLSVNYLGNPDNGVIIISYVASLLLAGAYLAIGMAMSSITSNQVVAFVLATALCFLFNVTGLPIVLDSVGALMGEEISLVFASMSLLTHFNEMQRGTLTLTSVVYFMSLIGLWLWVCRLALQRSREAG